MQSKRMEDTIHGLDLKLKDKDLKIKSLQDKVEMGALNDLTLSPWAAVFFFFFHSRLQVIPVVGKGTRNTTSS